MCKKQNQEHYYINHDFYGPIYFPPYNTSVPIAEYDRKLYNEKGNLLQEYFLRDIEFAHNLNIRGENFIFDRYNFSLKTHIYSHDFINETIGFPVSKNALLIESDTIKYSAYKRLYENKSLAKEFNNIFTYSDKLLDKYDNAKFSPLCAFPFMESNYEKNLNTYINAKNYYNNKSKNISIVSSNKLFCDLHKYRYDLANSLKNKIINIDVDTFGTFDNGPLVSLIDTLKDFRYTIAIENSISDYFFTEKITSAFVTQTVPIYVGARKINNFFNPDGIIQINTNDDIEKILKQCNDTDYKDRLPAILDNYNRVKEYLNPFDFLYKYLNN